MKKMIISMVIEGNEEELNTIKGNIISIACESLVSVSTDVMEEPPKVPVLMKFMEHCD